MSFLQFCQTFGGTLWLSFAETAFDSGLKNSLAKYAPTVSVAQVSAAGVSGIRSMPLPQGSSVEGVIMAYSVAVQHIFYIVAATASAAFVCSWGLGWKSVRKAEPVAPEA